MNKTKLKSLHLYLALFIFVVFIFDTLFHFVLVPFEQLEFTWISFKGDIDFTNIGIFNIVIRLAIYGLLAFKPLWVGKYLPLTLLVIALPTLYLMVDSWWVFENYLLLYGYWFLVLILIVYLTFIIQRKQLNAKRLNIVFLSSLFLSFFIVLVYVEIMGWSWPREFVYAFFQRVIYEPGFIFLVGLTHFIKRGK
ncbi:MAG: hypothetical protein ACO207_01700 [Bacilli bacterium]